jgi:hypothetical protein
MTNLHVASKPEKTSGPVAGHLSVGCFFLADAILNQSFKAITRIEDLLQLRAWLERQ